MAGNQTNVEHWFRLIYDCLHGACYGSMAGLSAFLSHLWLWIIALGYILSVIGLLVIVYCMIRLFELRRREHEFYSTLLVPAGEHGSGQSRWQHIQTLMEGTNPSEWKEAIVEADILLDEVLAKRGYAGAGVGEKLKSASAKNFATLQNAWEAHKVRNQIAHEGSAFVISDTLVRRTIAHYESVFREFKAI
jgi:hypothetical protein